MDKIAKFWKNLKKEMDSGELNKQYTIREERRFHYPMDSRIVQQHELRPVLDLLEYIETNFKNFDCFIEIDINQRKKQYFDNVSNFIDFLEQNVGVSEKKFFNDSSSYSVLFRYSFLGIALKNKKELYIIHPNYFRNVTYIRSYYYFSNNKKDSDRLKSYSYHLKDNEMNFVFHQMIKETKDLRLKIIIIHLFIEHYLNNLIDLIITRKKPIKSQIKYLSQKNNLLYSLNVIDSDLYNSCKEINRIRNHFSHNLFIFESLNELVDLNKIKLKNYSVDWTKKVKLDDHIDSIGTEILNELYGTYENLKNKNLNLVDK